METTPDDAHVAPHSSLADADAQRAVKRAVAQTIRSTKPLTIPVTPVSRLYQRHGPRLYSGMGAEQREPPLPATQVVRPSAVTVPVTPKLHTAARARSTGRTRPVPATQEPPSTVFKALRMPDFSAQKRSVSRQSSQRPLTVPDSPQLRIDKRPRSAPPRRVPEKPVPAPAPAAWGPRSLTEPEEFVLQSTRRTELARVVREQAQQRREAEAVALREALKAHPLPDFSHPFVPQPSSKELTEPSDFQLKSIDRQRQAREARRVAALAAERALAASKDFHAREAPRTLYEAPMLRRSSESRPPLVIREPTLQTAQRAAGGAYEALARRTAEREEEKRRSDAAQADKENAEMNLLRRLPTSEGGLVFKATPVLREDPFPAREVPAKKLTEPESPHLLIDRRMQRKLIYDENGTSR